MSIGAVSVFRLGGDDAMDDPFVLDEYRERLATFILLERASSSREGLRRVAVEGVS